MSEGLYILDGHNPVLCEDLLEWAKIFDKDRMVSVDQVGEVRISTVFLALDHSYGEGPPLVFETMIFGGVHDAAQERYSTWDEAEEGHKKAVELVRHTIS